MGINARPKLGSGGEVPFGSTKEGEGRGTGRRGLGEDKAYGWGSGRIRPRMVGMGGIGRRRAGARRASSGHGCRTVAGEDFPF